MIPRIIHQTWKNTDIPPAWLEAHQSWQFHHPGWSHRLWTDQDNLDLVAAEYPRLLEWYEALPYGILKADVARILILDHCGGVYSDLDTECLRPLGPLLADSSMVIGLEPDSHAHDLGHRRVLSNAVLAGVAGHSFLRQVISAFEACPRKILTHSDVLEQTGPLLLSRIFATSPTRDVTLLPSQAFSPLESNDDRLKILQRREHGFEDIREYCISRGAYVVHYWSNSWVGTLAGELYNPHPHDVPGFRFFPGMDSNGFDIGNGGRDVPELAKACLKNDAAVAFNTDGFLKSHIQPKSAWRKIPAPGEAEGLYVKEDIGIRDAIVTVWLTRCWRKFRRTLASGPHGG